MEKKHLFIGLVSALGAVSVTFISLFVWKSVASGKTPEPEPQAVEHFVTFESNGGTHVDPQRVEDGKTITKPADPKKEIGGFEYHFEGWYNGEQLYVFDTPVTQDITLTAKWSGEVKTGYVVTFENYGGTPHIDSQLVRPNGKAIDPGDLTRGEDEFLGWFTDFGLKNKYDFNTPVTNDITLYAGWKIAPKPETTHSFKFTGTNCLINGQDVFECDIAVDDQAQFAIVPLDKYTFPINDAEHFKIIKGKGVAIYNDETGYIEIGKMTSDVEIEASAVPVKTYTVHFKDAADDSKVSDDQIIEYNHIVQRPVNPTKEGCTFDKWYAEDKETEFDFDAPLTGESTEVNIYAKFTLNECHITYITNGGTLGAHIDSVDYGKPIATAPTVTRDGYDASQVTWWLDEAMTSEPFTFNSTLVKGDINLYAKWGSIKIYTVKFYDGDTDLKLDQTVEYGEKVQRPVNPTKEGCTFDKWYAEDKKTEFDFDAPLTGESTEVNIYAKFTLNKCHITYVLSGCTIEGPTSVDYGKTIKSEPTVTLDGKQIYPTWWTTPAFTEGSQFTFGEAGIGDPVKGDLILYGKYVPTAESFVNDSWDLFTSYIDGKTFAQIAEGSYKKEYEDNGNTFVGLSRTLTFTDEKGQPIVCHALVVDEDKNATATDNKFTFMITDLDLETTFAESNNFYKESYINSYLDILLWMFPTEVKQHMQTETIDCYNPATAQTEALSTSLYIPSASQIFGLDASKYPTENNQFAYFANSEHRTVLNGAWLRTPDQETQALSLYVNNASIDEDSITATHKLMPVFVIK